MIKFKFTTLNNDYTLHKSFIIADNIDQAYIKWVEMFGNVPFIGNLNIAIV